MTVLERVQHNPLVDKTEYHEICKQLHDEAGFDLLISLTAVDRGEALEVVVHLARSNDLQRAVVKALVDLNEPSLPSLCSLWPAANWHERECFDLFGITFTGHPNLKRILLREDFSGHPLRKNFQAVVDSVQKGVQ